MHPLPNIVRFLSQKIRRNSKIVLFIALKLKVWRFIGAKVNLNIKNHRHIAIIGLTRSKILVGVTFILFLISITYVNGQDDNLTEFKVNTINVFPEKITANNWENINTLNDQNLTRDSLYQEFNNINSAYIKIKNNDNNLDIQNNKIIEKIPSSVNEINLDYTEQIIDITDATIQELDVVENENATEQISEEIPVPFDEGIAEPDAQQQIDETPLEVMSRNFFRFVDKTTQLLPFVQESVTEQTPIFDSGNAIAAIDSEDTTSAVLEIDEYYGESPSSVEESEEVIQVEPELELIMEISDITQKDDSSIGETEDTADINIPESNVDPGISVEISQEEGNLVYEYCSENCDPYTIFFSGFDLPIVDETKNISGGQMRISFASKQASIAFSEEQQLLIKYSFDNGKNWSGGVNIMSFEESSNSINGGYYLMALPINEGTSLANLVVKIEYIGNVSNLDGIFIDSVWLELFTLEQLNQYEIYNSILENDGYTSGIISGDELIDNVGAKISFFNTDENEGETLIIKSNSSAYNGLTKATTYFNVTNISEDVDNFSLKIYFPDSVGKVGLLEEWNQNKPRNIVVPEYRPYVYYCSSEWELINDNRNNNTPSQMFNASTEPSSSSTPTSVISNLVGTDYISEVSDQFIFEEDADMKYVCSNTNVVRSCDSLDGDNTSCRMNDIKVGENIFTSYKGGWEIKKLTEGDMKNNKSIFQKIKDFIGFGVDTKEVPEEFSVKAYSDDLYSIEPGETKYFKMEIEFPTLSSGEFWIEAIGDSEYGLLDPYWSSPWQYRLPVILDNVTGTEDLIEQQVLINLTSVGLSDFWSNVNSDGSDVRFVAEVAGNEDETWYDTSWNRRTAITIQSSQVDASLTDFPVYIDLATLGNEFFANVLTDGADIRITNSDGSIEMPYEIVFIDTGGQTGELYFMADSVSDLVDTVFYIYYDNAGALGYLRTDTYGSENVWSNNYIAVYHLEEDAVGTGNVGLYIDATANNYDADDENASNLKDGQLGSGQEFGDTQTDYINLPPAVLDGETDVTQSWWHRTSQTGQQAIVSGATGPGSISNNEYLTFFTSSTGFNFYNDSVNAPFVIANHANNAWHAFTVLRNDSSNQVEFFVDGVADNENPETLSMSAISIGLNGLVVGQEQDLLGGGFSTIQNFEGSLDELRFSAGLRSSGWISSEYTNQNTPSVFYATSTAETLSTTQYTELDFWLQYFNATSSEADIWVQVDNIPAATSTTIYMYYGNVGATTASDEFGTFTYSTTTDIYYVLDSVAIGDIEVYSLIDNNIVRLDGGASIALNAGESTSFTGYSGNSVISVLGPISATIDDTAADTITPISFATTTLAGPTNRNISQYFIYSPFASSSVQTYIGGSVVPDESISIATGTMYTSNTDSGDNQAVIIESTEPILAYHRETGNRDSFVLYPPTTDDLFGIDSNATQVTTLTDNPDPTVYCSDGTSATVSGVTRGEEQGVNNCTQADEGVGNSVRFTGSLYPFAAIQQADSDGSETTVFLPQYEFSTTYYMTTDSAYAAVACSPRFGTSTIEVQTNSGATVESATCAPSGELPGKAYFVNGGDGDTLAFIAGHKIVSTNNVPFYVIYEDDVEDNDETNIWGAVQARKFTRTPITAAFGVQEVTIDAQYEQLSYGWYENINGQTPTSTWPLGEGSFATEGVAITGQGAVNDEDILRLRMNLQANIATGTASTSAFKLQYSASNVCSLTGNTWNDVGIIGSTTALFNGYNNTLVADGSELSSATLDSSTVFATYEEENLSSRNPNTINPGQVAEWDWVLQSKEAMVNTNYCFRMVRSAGQELVTYTTYPELYTAGPPLRPATLTYFDNQATAVFDSVLEFTAIDNAGDEIQYQVQIDDDLNFGSTAVDRNSTTNFLEFENLNTPSDKAPFDSGARIRFTSPTTLTASTTYWWRVRGSDPDGSNTNGEWSVPVSFTTDGSVTVSRWYQTTGNQFTINTLTNLSTSTTAVALASSPAVMTTAAIDFDDGTVGNAWGEVSWNDTETSGIILYQVEYLNGSSWQLVPDGEITNNSIGIDISPINILGLDTTTYNEIRIVATLTGTTLSIEDLTVIWGQKVETPSLLDPFDNEQTADTTPIFTFITTDPQLDDLEYEISYGTDYLFAASTTVNSSSTPADFANVTTPLDANPYGSGDIISYTIPGGFALTNNTTYWWRVRAKDPDGANSWSSWSAADAFTVNTGTVVSTWFQTTQEQFEQGTFDGLKASTSDSVIVNDVVGEYGRSTTTDNVWLEISTTNTYSNMVVAASARYTGNPQPERTVRIRNKTANSFEIKVDDYTNAFVGGSTVVDYMVVEAGDWTILDGGTGTRIVAGTVSDVTDVKSRVYTTSGSDVVNFSPSFSVPPVVLASVSSDNDTTWVFTHTDDGANRANEPTISSVGFSLARSFESAVHDPEDIDYIAMDMQTGLNDGIQFDFMRSPDAVSGVAGPITYNNTSFTVPPGVNIVNNIGEDGGDGGFAFIETATPSTATELYPEIGEGGVGANGHTDEIISIVAFESDSGILLRDNTTVNLTGTIASEFIYFSDGAGPKFEQYLFSKTSPGNSTTSLQVQYLTSTSSWVLVPDTEIPGNSVGITTSPVNLTDVDVDTYDTIRLLATLECDGSNCPELQSWAIEWSEGITISGTARQYDRATNVISGIVSVAVNDTLIGSTGSIAGDGTWTINNVTAFDGDVITVFINEANEANEAVNVFVYDGIGDVTNVDLFEQHLTISADETATTTIALLGVYDNSVSGDEDIFFNVNNITNDLTVCSIGSCSDANLYIGAGNVFVPATSTVEIISTHDFVNDGIVQLNENIIRVSGSWSNNATLSTDLSSVIFTATSTTESITDTSNLLSFYNLTFGEVSGAAIWQTNDSYDINGNLSVNFGTFDRSSSTLTVAGGLSTGANGFWLGVASTTFDGSGTQVWSDNNGILQNIGNVVINGSAAVSMSSDVRAQSILIESGNIFSAGGANDLYISGDFTNNNIFTAQTGTIVVDGLGVASVIDTGASSLYNLIASTTDGGSVSFSQTSIIILGNFTVATGTVTMPTGSASIGGNFANTGGMFLHNNAEIIFTGDGIYTIQQQGTPFFNAFYDLTFNGSGAWSWIDTNATTTNNFVIENGIVTLPSSELTVGADFTTSGGSFVHNNGQVTLLILGPDTITTNDSAFNDVIIRESAVSPWYDTNWAYRLPVVIDASLVNADLTNFPIYINLADLGSGFFTNLNSGGGDIRVTQSDGTTEVAREIVSADTTLETGQLHFNATNLSSTTDTTFYIYYGNTSASDYSISSTYGAQNVWDANYLAVYHLEENSAGSGNLGLYQDSTSNNADGDDEIDATGQTGQIGAGQQILGRNTNDDDYILIPNTVLNGESDLTISYWFQSAITASQAFVSGGASNQILFFQQDAQIVLYDGGAGPTFTYTSTNDGNWHQMNIVRDATSNLWSIYIDGQPDNQNPQVDTLGALSIPVNCLVLGQEQDSCAGGFAGSQAFEGYLDEVIFSRGVRSDSWIATTYENQASTTNFYSVSVAEEPKVRTFVDTNTTVLGDLVIESGVAVFPTGILGIGGSFDNNGLFTSNSGTVVFDSSAGVETIAAGNSSFSTLRFAGVGGDFTITENATATVAIHLTNASSFTLDSGLVLESLGTFTNNVGGASTTWIGSTLRLSSGIDFSINTKTDTEETYATILTTADTDISMWNSAATVYTTQDTSSIYSQDHNGTDGDLYIFGDYVRSSGTEYWNYATDFDGTVLVATTSRIVNVRPASGASIEIATSSLQIVGVVGASSTIVSQAGTFTLRAQTATVTASYFEMSGTDIDGFQLLSSSTAMSLNNALFTIGTGVSAMTVDSSTIDTNPASQFFNTNFVTGGGSANVTLSGSPTSYWWFRDGAGDRYGEAFDNADGDPGAIRWDDSSYVINISGVVYSDDGDTPLGGPACDGITNTVRIVIDGGTYTDIVPCSGANGSYSFNNVTYIGDPSIIVYLDTNGGLTGSVITKTPTADITNMDIYVNRVMTRHEDITALSIADMAIYDETEDSDIRFIAATSTVDTLTVRPETELYIFATTTFTPSGTIVLQSGGSGQVYDGTLHIGSGATFIGTGTTTYSIGGSFLMEFLATFIAASSTVSMTATTSGKTITHSSAIAFNELEFIGVGGGWNVNTDLSIYTDMYVATGTITGTGDVVIQTGSLYGNGIVSLGEGTVTINTTNTFGGTAPWLFNNLILGSGSVVGTTTPASVATTTISGVFTVNTAHFLDAGTSIWNLTGSGNVFIESGTFIEDVSTVQYGGISNANVLNTTYYNLKINTPSGSPIITVSPGGLQVLNDLRIGGLGTTALNLNINDPVVSVLGNVFISSNGVLVGSDNATLTVSGDWDNNGIFTSSSGLIDFDSTDAFTISAGASSFGDVLISTTGIGTISENATSTGVWTFASTSNVTVSNDVRLAVGKQFTNNAAGAATTWTGSTLHLFGAGNYEINASTTIDSYNVLSAGTGTHIRMWNSDAATYLTASNGSIYSMDHLNTAGDLYIFGDYIQNSLGDNWSYEADFDGTVLSGGARRAVGVYMESDSTATWNGGELTALGSTTATTTIQNQGIGTYGLTFGGSTTINWNYGIVRDIDIDGVTFAGAPVVQDFSYTDLLVEINNGTTITVEGTAINASPAKNFTGNIFASSGGVTGAVNVTATGTTVSSWRYTNTAGALAGEVFDSDPAGDPGYIVWDDSVALITIAGNVYSDEGATVSSVCDDVTPNVLLRVAGLTTASTTCNASTGAYSISNVTFSTNDTLTLYITGETVRAVNVSIDPISSISDMDLYENRVIVRHESTDPISILDMSVWDSSDDVDIPFAAVDAGTDTLTLPSDTKLIVWNNKEFTPNGEVTLSGGGTGASYDGTLELFAGAIFTAAGTQNHNIGGSLILGADATYIPANSTTTFITTGAGRIIDLNNQALNNVVFNGSGSWTMTDATFTANGDVLISAGTLTLPSGTSTLVGSFENTGGSFAANDGLLYFIATTSSNNIEFGDSDANNITFDGLDGSWNIIDTNATSTGLVDIRVGSVTLPGGIFTIGADFVNTDTIVHNAGEIKLTQTSGSASLTLNGNDLYSVTIGGGADFTMTDSNAALLGNLTIASGTLVVSTSTLSIGGSLDVVGGIMNAASGTILFNSTDVGETINLGSSSFYNVSFSSAGGGWTISNNATATGNFSLSSASSFTLSPGSVLYVGGIFTNFVGGAATTWTGSTLSINSGSTYTINTKIAGGDSYSNILIGSSTSLRMWNSLGTTTLLDISSSLYSQDHAGVNGSLYIYGDYTRSTGADYWSYTTDFDGASLSGSERQAYVYFEANATTTFFGGSLNVIGTDGFDTTISNQGTGTFALHILGGTFNAQYYSLTNMDSMGLVLNGTTTITSLTEGNFNLTVNTGSLITLSSTTLNQNTGLVISNTSFATTSSITGYNINVVGTTTGAWTLTGHTGNLAGENFDVDIDANCGSVRWDDSSCLLTQESGYRFRNDDGGEGIPDSEWFNGSWSKRQRITLTNSDSVSYIDAAIKLDIIHDNDMRADFDDLRFTSFDGTTQIDHFVETYTASTDSIVWVKIPLLATSTDTEIYMYYGNGSAGDGSTTTVFSVIDEFEDNNISEYSGDTSEFIIDNTEAYERTYKLEASDPGNGKTALGGMYNNSFTVSQGEKIRFLQYIDTSIGSGDEVCTLFGTQSQTQNYAVCLELYGTDRMSLVEDALYNDTSGTILASTTVVYSTGWYEIEIDWDTDNSIFVTLSQNGSIVATTTATDSTYTSGGIGYALWFYHGAWDVYSSRPLLETEPTIKYGFEQVGGGASWIAALNTKGGGVEIDDIVRVRFLVENTGLAVTDQNYEIEFAAKGSAPSCEAVDYGDYVEIPNQSLCGTSGLCMQTSSNITNLESTTDILGSSGTFIQGQIVEDPGNNTGNITVGNNEYTELEYVITPTSSVTDSNYCLRVTNEGTDLDSYTKIAELELLFVPNITSLSLNGGNDIILTGGSTTTITATGTVTDLNGYSDLDSATSTMFRSGVTADCSADDNNCYISSDSLCSFTNCSGNSCDVICTADIYYYADPTDIGTFAGETWREQLEVSDMGGMIATATAPSVDLITLRAINVDSSISYGTLPVNSNTGLYNATTTVENIGNDAVDVAIEGTNLSDGGSSSIPVSEQIFATSTFNYSACTFCSSLDTTPTNYELNLSKPASTTPAVTDDVFWGIAIPFGVAGVVHQGINTFYAIGD